MRYRKAKVVDFTRLFDLSERFDEVSNKIDDLKREYESLDKQIEDNVDDTMQKLRSSMERILRSSGYEVIETVPRVKFENDYGEGVISLSLDLDNKEMLIDFESPHGNQEHSVDSVHDALDILDDLLSDEFFAL